MDDRLAKKAGLVSGGKDEEGEQLWIGTDYQWHTYEQFEREELEGHGLPDLEHAYPDDFATK